MKRFLHLSLLLLAAFFTAQPSQAGVDKIAVATFEDLTLEAESHWCGGEPDEDTGMYLGGFTNGSFYFNTGAMPEWDYWYFFGYANSTATKYESLADQWNNCLGGGYKSTNYGVAYAAAFNGPCEVKVLANNGEGAVVPGFMITNSAYALSSMMNGDASAKKFTEDDWFKLTITGYKGEEETGKVDFYLAKDGKFVTSWDYVDLSSLGKVTKLAFALSSTDNGDWGMNTPAYFCFDDFGAECPTFVQSVKKEGTPAANNIYDLNGRSMKQVRRGNAYIINGKATFVK